MCVFGGGRGSALDSSSHRKKHCMMMSLMAMNGFQHVYDFDFFILFPYRKWPKQSKTHFLCGELFILSLQFFSF